MLRPAYAVEYDYLPATQVRAAYDCLPLLPLTHCPPLLQCHNTLETKRHRGLFFSGQLNGTTGEITFWEGSVSLCL